MLKVLKDCVRPLFYFITSQNYREYTRLFSKYNAYPRFSRTKIRFLKYEITAVDAPSFVHQFKEIFFEEVFNTSLKKMDPVIYDCGANIGMSCLYFRKVFPQARIKAFEADPDIFNVLQENILSNVGNAKIEFVNKAIWIHNEGVEFNVEGADGGSIEMDSFTKATKVDSIRLKELLDTEHVDFLKMDIEGAEVDVLLDCDGSLGNVDFIFFEYHSFLKQPQKLDSVLKVLTKNKFKYYIQSSQIVYSPFIQPINHPTMDMQLNIYCYK